MGCFMWEFLIRWYERLFVSMVCGEFERLRNRDREVWFGLFCYEYVYLCGV